MDSIMGNGQDRSRELRKFAITVSIALGIFGSVILWRKGETGLLCWGVGLLILLIGLFSPRLLSPIYRFWMALARLMGFVMTHLILALMYYFVLTPVGLVMRMLGKNPLKMRFTRSADSYWIKRRHREFGNDRYEKMF